jgi:hypothetical protein
MTSDPRSFRLQVRTHVRLENPNRDAYPEVLWEETGEYWLTPITWRYSTQGCEAENFAAHGYSVAAGEFRDGTFKADYFVSPERIAPKLALIEGAR